ncbi:MAG: YdeI/OmpD-associated family protein [Flavobacteriales bacterium]|nr:YdeI/OmpD-associated family protein [Flavobacteriales bacterium]
MDKPLVNKKYILEKFHGKGGWTYARIPEILPDKHAHFGWRKVKGTIDGFEIKRYHLMPMGNGNLFLPVKAEIRKKIKKEEGDFVHVVLYPDSSHLEVPEELLLCLQDEPTALKFFQSLSESEQNYYIQWIYSAKKEETKVKRVAQTINRLMRGEKRYENVKVTL